MRKNWKILSLTSLFKKGSPVFIIVHLNVRDQNMIFFRSLSPFLQTNFFTRGCSNHLHSQFFMQTFTITISSISQHSLKFWWLWISSMRDYCDYKIHLNLKVNWWKCKRMSTLRKTQKFRIKLGHKNQIIQN